MFFLFRIEHRLMPNSIIHSLMSATYHFYCGVLDVLLSLDGCPCFLCSSLQEDCSYEERFMKERRFTFFVDAILLSLLT